MVAQVVTGYALMRNNIKRYFRAVDNPDAVDDETIADAIWEGERFIHDLVLEAGVYWSTRVFTTDDSAKGVTVDFQVKRLFISQDLAITDFARVARLWRVSPDKSQPPAPIYYLANPNPAAFLQRTQSRVAGFEAWTEGGDFNASGLHDRAIYLYNYGQAMSGGQLRIEYWWSPPQVLSSWFYEVDASGNLVKGPSLPYVAWPWIMNYAKWVISEQTGDELKRRALLQRFKGKAGIEEMARNFFANIQTGEPVHSEAGFEEG